MYVQSDETRAQRATRIVRTYIVQTRKKPSSSPEQRPILSFLPRSIHTNHSSESEVETKNSNSDRMSKRTQQSHSYSHSHRSRDENLSVNTSMAPGHMTGSMGSGKPSMMQQPTQPPMERHSQQSNQRQSQGSLSQQARTSLKQQVRVITKSMKMTH